MERSSISYPKLSVGTERTELEFCGGALDAGSILYGAEADGARLFVTDETVAALPCLSGLAQRCGGLLVVLKAGEAHKTLDSALAIVRRALEHNLPRRAAFVGIGGGVVCDLTAFAASLYKRGCVLELVPTTLLAMADAAVGGKTGCDFAEYKNMLGSFYPARWIRFFPAFLQSLSAAEYRSGLAEVLKTALLFDEPLFGLLEREREAVLRRDEGTLTRLIRPCVEAKARVVEADLTERNVRMLLNYGHTFAHALETAAGLGRVSHGDAVAWGIGRALDVSVREGLCAASYRDRVRRALAAYGWTDEPVHPALRESLRGQDGADVGDECARRLLLAMKNDKKNDSEGIRLVLQSGMTQNLIREFPAERIAPSLQPDAGLETCPCSDLKHGRVRGRNTGVSGVVTRACQGS